MLLIGAADKEKLALYAKVLEVRKGFISLSFRRCIMCN